MKSIFRFFSSSVLALLLLLVFAAAMAIATFIENDFGTDTAWIKIYDALWFELVMVGLALCFLANTFKYNLWRKEKWAVLLFHLAFIIIIIGAGITRYDSYGGIMRIREGEKSSTIISDKNYLKVHISNSNKTRHLQKKMEFSPLNDNSFSIETDIEDTPVVISLKEFVADAVPEIIDDSEKGTPMLQMVTTSGNGRETLFLTKGEVEVIGLQKHKIGFEAQENGIINITEENGEFKIWAPHPLDFFVMSDQKAGVIKGDTIQPMTLKTLYRQGDLSFVPLSFHKNGSMQLISTSEKPHNNDPTKDDAVVLHVKVGDKSEDIMILYRKGFLPTTHEINVDDITLSFSYGAMPIEIPFAVKLNEFQLERYPGSESPSSYASEVTVLDGDTEMPFRIYMNNVLDYGGFRFYQASYDTDEKGTLLAVNHDLLGTVTSYIGYSLMTIGMFFTLFGKRTRFTTISKKLKKIKQIAPILLLMLASSFETYAQSPMQKDSIPSVTEIVINQEIEKQHSDLFGRIMVQDMDGRIKPINTLASEFLRKIYGKTTFNYKADGKNIKLDANQVFLAMHVSPGAWQKIPVIKIDAIKGGDYFKPLKITEDGYISFDHLINPDGDYVLSKLAEDANAKKPAEQNEFDKEVIKVDERFNILFNIFSGNYLKIFPNSLDEKDTWFSYNHHFNDFPSEDGHFVQNITRTYFNDLAFKNWSDATDKLSYIDTYQSTLGAAIIPTQERVEAELWYNQMNLNFWLFQTFFTIGLIMLVLALSKIFVQKRIINFLWNILIIISLISFIVFTGNILLRWYIAGHPPWSNGYEMMVFVAWVLMLCGLMTFRKSDFALPLATLFSGSLLFVSYLDWLNPEITNLMPVLKSSFWLKVHVATIVSSYAPLALSAVLGFMALILIIIRTKSSAKIIDLRIKELTYINEISMTIGLFVLTIGTFLGGVWANESWGRYWAWDPKETWALISIIVYAIVLHLRMVPALNNRYTLNVTSVFAFASIIMTSYGVNYYLTGLHSYAAGDPVPIPTFIYILTIVVIIIAIIAFIRSRKPKTIK
ncbi:cytochrome C biogenesis protein [Bizionia argentinensis JUB59]|uniref:Cytochrome C biogenesis protein n=1 Tax=Bizionia argentinensis JUB59 TaxID=1046627 RepID=G2EHL2_9FLAO|nr:cytochrome c biogenesis protein CcsA [Bizionia argentinensis]EGV42063.2 cytochrome C biogenesis protein [Bizionia argentinensis JUB59]